MTDTNNNDDSNKPGGCDTFTSPAGDCLTESQFVELAPGVRVLRAAEGFNNLGVPMGKDAGVQAELVQAGQRGPVRLVGNDVEGALAYAAGGDAGTGTGGAHHGGGVVSATGGRGRAAGGGRRRRTRR